MNEDDKQGILSRMLGGWNRLRQNPIADVALGFTPAGLAADVQDASKAIRDRDALGLGLASLGFIPGVGDVAKGVAKAARGADVARRLPREVLEDAPKGTLSLREVLTGGISKPPENMPISKFYDPQSVENISEYAAREYEGALSRGIPMDLESVASRRQAQFPLEGYHGTKVLADTENIAGRDLLEEHPLMRGRSFFAGVGEEGRDIASSYDAWGGGSVVPLAIDPGKALEVDALGNAYSSIPLESAIGPLLRAGDLSEDEIVDLLIEAEPELWFDVVGAGRKNIDDRVDYLYRATEPDFERAFDPFSAPDDLSTDDLGKIAKLAGYDSSVIRNVLDKYEADQFLSGIEKPGDIIVIPNPIGRIRHRSAVFDPERKNVGNIFAGAAGATIGGTALSRYLNRDNRREER